nr:hypothetical protein [Tanacetum cinerariifolium]
MNNEPPQTFPSFDSTCYSDKENSAPCVLKPNFVDESSNIFNPPPQPPIFSYEFCRSNAQYDHYCTPQVPFIYLEPGWNRPAFYDDDDDDDVDYIIAITPALSTEETDNSLSMGDEHLDTIPATELDELIKSSVENLVPILSESEGILDTMCDVHLVNNHTPFEAKDHFEIVINSNDEFSSSDDDSLYKENIEYVEASPHNSELVSLEVAEIVIPEVKEIEDDNLHEKLLNKQEEKRIEEKQAANARYWKIPACCDDDDDYDSAITPILSTEETENSLIPSEFKGIPDTMCDVHLDNNHTPLKAKDHVEIVINSNDDISSSDDDSLHEENIEYVEASPHDSEHFSLEAAEIVILEVEEIEDDNLREKLLNVYLLIANIEALKDNPTQSSFR